MSTQLHRLSNGFRVVTEHMPGLQSASVGIWVSAGGRHEAIEQNGIAHFLEHMAFKGTAQRSALDIAEQIEDVGGYINAYTSREVTAFYARVLKDDVALAAELIADIVLNPTFDPREIEIERGVILQEIGQALDTPDDIIFDWLQEAAYPAQPMGRTILGPSERVSAFDRTDLQTFTAQNYGPGQMILAAAGAVDHDALCRMAEDLFGHLPARPQAVPQASLFKGGEFRQIRDLEQAHLALGFDQPGYRDDAIYAAQIFAGAMGGGMSSRLFQEAREKRGLCYTIFASIGAYSDAGMLTVYAGTGAEDVGDLARLTIDELKRSAEDMTEVEVARARAQMKSGMLMGLESPSSRAERLARVVAVWDRVPPLSEAIEKIDAVDVAMVRAHAEALTATVPALALYGPVEAAPDADVLRQRLAA
ncbi:M16 family metallopeptidase [Jannaschia helgolandensis]|uniref:Predicted Zn-dependent peptidase n=2 Tax=Jannaschia helgolandensis TaxID=188906 RepID=A0A1H7INV2_9RHOB|nr:pitrilysin family protein [Jannaschia helgolandensis]SEK63572.1 Predicted Zn-dependent peptidase [Jannaschia helgolandensis]